MRSIRLVVLVACLIVIVPHSRSAPAGPALSCGNSGGLCSVDSDCCSRDCNAGTCRCSDNGQACNIDADCCYGFCSMGTCQTNCEGQFAGCSSDSQCCSNLMCTSNNDCDFCGDIG